MIVKAFDGSQSSVFGEVHLLVKIGPHMFYITFQVIEVASMVTLPVEKIKKPIVTSWRYLQIVVEDGTSKSWGKLVEIPDKKNHFGLGYGLSKATLKGKA